MSSPVSSPSESSFSAIPSLSIPDEAMGKIADLLVETFKGQIESLVDKIVSGVVDKLNDKIESLESLNTELVRENSELKRKIDHLEEKVDDQEQYSRRNLLRVSGIPESKDEVTDEIILPMCNAVEADISLCEIDRSHRVGRPKRAKSKPGLSKSIDVNDKPRDFIIKFTSYRSHQKLFLRRSSLKNHGYKNIYVNEDLTRKRSNLLFKAHELVKSKHFIGVWSSDGKILVKDNKSKLHRVSNVDDLDMFLLD